ncbi:Cna B-type domain-containing protein [Butyrivibrio sp. FCS014]|uniref:Cna B-type domain-containing protein n=1 Tax=Butyrivibrio sp. FCS014 TaxID=1408304 RepID=UPI0004BB701D|nr:Cna B-type domain-containing protein [Butyrivibrio sp. FCS014]
MNKLKNIYIRISAIIVAVLMAIIAIPSQMVSAAPNTWASIDLGKKGSLTITHFSVDEELMENVRSYIYLVATIDENGTYTITDEFKGCFDDPDFFNNDFNYDDWKECVDYQTESDSDNLQTYIKENGIKEVDSKVSDSKGKTCYTDLELGIYYVLSDKVEKDDYTHSFVNFVYPVPILEYDEATGQIIKNYNPSASPKKAKVKNDIVVHCHLYKRWNDSGNTDKRPASVTFNIYCDDELMETVTLSESNGWSYEWSNEGVHTYNVEEVGIGSGYSSGISIYQQGHEFWYTCTNSYTPPETPPDTPPDTPPGNPPETPDTPGTPDFPDVLGAIRELPAVLGARRLPQTGQLWWPIPILVIAGIVFIVKGIRKNRKNVQ